MTRHAIVVADDNGIYSIDGRCPLTWAAVERDLEQQYAYEDAVSVDYEPLLGWRGWSYGILVNGSCVTFVDGTEPPATVLGQAVEP